MMEPSTAAGTRRPLKKSMEERMYSSPDWVEPPRIVRAEVKEAAVCVMPNVMALVVWSRQRCSEKNER